MSADEENYSLVMPFVVCQSEDGPYDDLAFTAGFEVGHLDARLAYEQPAELRLPVRTASLPQIDLVAMRYGYSLAEDGHSDEEWTSIALRKVV